jgi:hypothetical protein
MAYFVRSASKIAFKRIKMVFLIKRFAKICVSKTYQPQFQFFFLYQGMVYIFEMSDIVFTKTETPKSRQIESQDCLKFANLIEGHVDCKVFLGKNTEIMGFRRFLHS